MSSDELPDLIGLMKSFLDRPEVKELVDKTKEMVGNLEGTLSEKMDQVFARVNESIEAHGGFDNLMSKMSVGFLPLQLDDSSLPNIQVMLTPKERVDYLEAHPDKVFDEEGDRWSSMFAQVFRIPASEYEERLKNMRVSLEDLASKDKDGVYAVVLRELDEHHVEAIPHDIHQVFVITENIHDLTSWRVKNARRLLL